MKILYIWVVAIVMVIAFGGALSLSRVLWKSIFEIQHETKIHSLTGSEMDRAVVSLVSGASATLHVPFVLHLFGCMFLHFHFICMHLPFIVHSCPFMFLSYSFHFHSNVHSCPLILLSFARIFLSFCIRVLSFQKLWKWLHGLAREPSATNGYR